MVTDGVIGPFDTADSSVASAGDSGLGADEWMRKSGPGGGYPIAWMLDFASPQSIAEPFKATCPDSVTWFALLCQFSK